MRITRLASNPLAQRANIGGAVAATLAAVLAGPAPRAHEARVQDFSSITAAVAPPVEVWICTDAKPSSEAGMFPLELALRDGILSEQPYGVTRYRGAIRDSCREVSTGHRFALSQRRR